MEGTRGGQGREGQGRRHPTPGHRPTRRGLRPWGCRLRTRRPAAPRRPSRRTPPPAAGPRSRSGRSGSRRTRPLGGWPGRSWGHCGEKGHVLSSDPEPRRRARCYRMSGPPEGAGGPELMALPHPHCPDTAPRAARGLGRVTATRWRPRRGQDAGKHSARLPDRFPGPWRPPSRSPPQPTGSGGGGGWGGLLSGWKLQANPWAGHIGAPTPGLSPHGPSCLRSVPAALQLAQRGPPATGGAQFPLLTRWAAVFKPCRNFDLVSYKYSEKIHTSSESGSQTQVKSVPAES